MRLIDADALENASIPFETHGGGRFIALGSIRSAPTIDPASLRPKGGWENDKDDVYWHNHFIHKHCSVCNSEPLFRYDIGKYKLTNFCPNCGADMRKEATPNV